MCSCYFGFAGYNCSQYDCSEVNDCSGKGSCVEPNLCSCNMGYEGEACLTFSCGARNRCSGQYGSIMHNFWNIRLKQNK